MSFVQDGDGKTIVMKCHKSGFEFEMLREGYTPSTEIDVAKAARYLGRYRSKLQSADYEVRVQNHRLAVDIPGMAIFELHPPSDDGKMSFRAMPTIRIAFDESSDGQVESMSLNWPGREEQLPRLVGTP